MIRNTVALKDNLEQEKNIQKKISILLNQTYYEIIEEFEHNPLKWFTPVENQDNPNLYRMKIFYTEYTSVKYHYIRFDIETGAITYHRVGAKSPVDVESLSPGEFREFTLFLLRVRNHNREFASEKYPGLCVKEGIYNLDTIFTPDLYMKRTLLNVEGMFDSGNFMPPTHLKRLFSEEDYREKYSSDYECALQKAQDHITFCLLGYWATLKPEPSHDGVIETEID